MRVAWAAWVQGLLGLAKAALVITMAVILVQQVYFGPNRLAAARADVINRFDVSTDMPRTVYDLMDLYPQGAKGRPSVFYVPVRRGFGGSDPFPSLPGRFP